MPTLQSHTFASRTNRHTSQSLQKSVPVPPQKEFQNIFSSPSKKIKTPDTQSDTPKTLKRIADNGLQGRPTRTPAGNSGFAKKRVQWLIEHSTSHQLLWYIDSLVLRNPLLRKAAKR
jgi:hypothetical protein